ncbi:MAG: diguanylate cyclase [Pseudomonadales bacterium]
MKKVLGLSNYLLRNLSIPKKLMLMGALLLIPLSLQAYFFTQNIQHSIDVARNEQLGIEYSLQLRQLLEHLPVYRGANFATTLGDNDFSKLEKQELQLIETAIEQIDQVNWRIGRQLEVDEYWARLKAQWQILAHDSAFMSPEVRFEKHTQFVNDLLSVMVLVGDNSGLVLDPNIESYYLMTLLVHELPELVSTTQTLRGLSVGSRAQVNENLHIPTLLGVLRDHQIKVVKVQGKVMQENAHLREEMGALMDLAVLKLSNLRAVLKAKNAVLSNGETFVLASDAVQSIFKIYDFSAVELNALLEQQIEQMIEKKVLALGLIALCLLITLYLYAGFYFAMVRDLAVLVKASKHIGSGDAGYRINVMSKDELGTVATGFNDMAKALGRSKRDVDAAYGQLERLTRLDPLTALPNRRSLDEALGNEWQRAIRNSSSLSVLMIDIDHFKQFNDSYGHTAGDDCLKMVANELAAILKRGGDFIARYGGEEFIVISPETDIAHASELAAVLQQGVENLFISHQGSDISDYVTISLGVASLSPKKANNTTSKELVERADRALYRAKENGRNRFEVDDVKASLPVTLVFPRKTKK